MHRLCGGAILFTLIAVVLRAAPQEQALREAARLDAEGRCEEAEPYYERALASGPPSPALLNNAGNHYLVCGAPEKARSYFERLLKANPSHTNANLQLARMATERKQGAEALKYLARVKDSDPAIRLLRGEASYWAGKRESALANLEELGKEATGDPRVLFTLGAVYARLGLYDRAEAAFHSVLVKRPDDFDVLFNLGRAAARAGHYDQARRALGVALKIRPEDTDTLLELGLVEAAAGDYTRAVYLLAQAGKRAPKRPDIVLALARAAEDAGYYGDSALAYDKYLDLRPDDDTARRDRARVYGYSGTRLEEGLKEMAWYARKHPEDPVGFYNLAQFSWRTDPEKSLEQLATALRLNPEFSPAHLSRAWLLHRLGRTAESVPHLEAAIKITPDNVRALDQLGLAYLSLDRPGEAAKSLRRALGVAPEDPEVLMHMGRALMALGREEEAQRFLEKYQELRPRRFRDPRKEPGMIESATLPAAERRNREIERFRRMSRARPDDPLLQMHLAGLLLADGRVEEAAAEFRGLLRLNADSRIWEEAGRSLVRAEQYELARQFLERAAAERPGARLDLAIALFFTAGAAEALEAIDKIPDGEQTGDYWLTKAKLLDAAGRVEEAQELLVEGLRHSASRPQVVQQAALLLVRYGRKTEAMDLLEQGIASAPDSGDLLLTKAVVLALTNRTSGAEQTLRTIESRWPEWDRPYLVHGLVLERGEKKSEARQKLRTAVALGSRDTAAECALARLSASSAPNPQCACQAGLYEWLFPACGKR